jgi:hypothetical protein
LSVLTIIQDVCDRLSLTRPSAVVTSTDTNVRQLFALLKEGTEELSKFGGQDGGAGWQSLVNEQTFVTVADFEQSSAVPEDFRRFIPNTFWNRTSERPVTGPMTPQQWQAQRARGALSQLYLGFRQRDGSFLLSAGGSTVPTAGETIAYEYVSSYWAQSSAGQPKATFTSDDDTSYLDEALLKLDLKWRWKHAKGLDYGEDLATFERAKLAAYGADGGSTQLDIGGPSYAFPWWRYNLPEGSFGL